MDIHIYSIYTDIYLYLTYIYEIKHPEREQYNHYSWVIRGPLWGPTDPESWRADYDQSITCAGGCKACGWHLWCSLIIFDCAAVATWVYFVLKNKIDKKNNFLKWNTPQHTHARTRGEWLSKWRRNHCAVCVAMTQQKSAMTKCFALQVIEAKSAKIQTLSCAHWDKEWEEKIKFTRLLRT